MIVVSTILSLLCIANIALAQDIKPAIKNYGQRGHIFAIKERSLLEVIKERLLQAEKSGKIKELQALFQKKVKYKVAHPVPVPGLRYTTKERTFYYDPTYTQIGDITDHNDRVIVADGTTVNPLEHIAWGAPVFFIDGDDPAQIKWALQQTGEIVLVKGSPLELQRQYDRWFYFDQAGILIDKFDIMQVPAVITQEKNRLKIEEVFV